MPVVKFNEFIIEVDQIGKLARRFSSDLSKSIKICRPDDVYFGSNTPHAACRNRDE